MMKRFLSYVKGWHGITLITYMWLILMAWVFVYVDFSAPDAKKLLYIVSAAEFILLVLVYVCPKLLELAEHTTLKHKTITKPQKHKIFITSLLLSFCALFITYIVFYPGAFSPDSIDQYRQASGIKNYNDWHPVLHTLFAFTLPLRVSGEWIGSIILFQIVVVSVAMAYMLMALAEYGNVKYSFAAGVYILLNPLTLSIVMYPWKDVTFAVFSMLSMACAAKIYFSRGEWLNRKLNMLMFVLILSCATIFRHNAILFTLPLLLCVLFYAGRAQKIFLAAGCCAVILIVRSILYPSLGAEKPNYRIVETTCTPMTIIANAVYERPDSVDKDIAEFLYTVAPKKEWQENYVLGSFNSVKFRNINRDAIEKTGYAKIFDMALRCVLKVPFSSLRGFFALTDMVYGILGPVDWGVSPGIADDSAGIRNFLQRIFRLFNAGSRVMLKHIFWHTGILLLVILVFILAKADFRKMCFSLPILAYDFGTMLFLGGNDFRFFWCTYLVFPLVLLILIRENSEAKS